MQLAVDLKTLNQSPEKWNSNIFLAGSIAITASNLFFSLRCSRIVEQGVDLCQNFKGGIEAYQKGEKGELVERIAHMTLNCLQVLLAAKEKKSLKLSACCFTLQILTGFATSFKAYRARSYSTCFFQLFMNLVRIHALFIEIKRYTLYPRVDLKNEETLPHKFRTAQSAYKSDRNVNISRDGLDHLPISGSHQFSENGLKKIIEELKVDRSKITIVNLRAEFMGFFDGLAVGFKNSLGSYEYDFGLTAEEMHKQEKSLLNSYEGVSQTFSTRKEPAFLKISSAITEKDLVEGLGMNYVRFPIKDRVHPKDNIVDQIIAFIRDLPEDGWLHLHCAGGMGRTTIIMTIVDMFFNSDKLSAEDIIKRQWAIGGSDLIKGTDLEDGEMTMLRYEQRAERIKFLYKFYQYCKECAGTTLSWSDWLKRGSFLPTL
ncbi:MAG: hypothetical protein L0207_05770 [Chlamydiae bacterium]|nr:hypothetical protein [Chlamydiota bacterium]